MVLLLTIFLVHKLKNLLSYLPATKHHHTLTSIRFLIPSGSLHKVTEMVGPSNCKRSANTKQKYQTAYKNAYLAGARFNFPQLFCQFTCYLSSFIDRTRKLGQQLVKSLLIFCSQLKSHTVSANYQTYQNGYSHVTMTHGTTSLQKSIKCRDIKYTVLKAVAKLGGCCSIHYINYLITKGQHITMHTAQRKVFYVYPLTTMIMQYTRPL